MPSLHTFVIILIGCCPGGAASNAFALFADGDIAMSIAMTTVSNILAFASLPLLLFLWTRGLPEDVEFAIPFLEIFYSLLMVLLPCLCGIWLRFRHPRKAKIAEKVGTIGAALLILSSIVVGVATNIDTLSDSEVLPWKNIVAVMLVAPIGMAFALLAAFVIDKCRGERTPLPALATIVIETGVQNSVLAMAIVSLSYSAALAGTPAFFQLQLIVIMWGIMVSFEALCVTLVFRWFIRGGDCASFCSKELPKGVAEPVVSDSMGNDNVSKTQAGIEGGAIKALEVESVAE
jgi:predicted Na+-dependent transporter